MHILKHGLVFLLACGLALGLFARESQAQIVISAGPSVSVPLGEIADSGTGGVSVTTGWSLKGFVGYELPVPLVKATVLVTGGYTMLPTDPPDIGNADLNITQCLAGARLGLGGFIQPSLMLAVGYGWVSGEGSDYTLSHDGLSVLAGLGVEFTGVPLFDIGLHTDYNQLHYADGGGVDYQWVDIGLTLARRF
ncbi:MAG: hypothetical protein AUK47_10205 [Deltaproteobacteria bacterium CG2_30_63_29]|nr:MAG: hypothetical protein AUK47_10205 [Deltaproteobacteria bacterium CG2_30_63_29]PJB34482.1 MAG: hypothetical protein CO108_28215 [Deltaproteobacteria bacterium CG_4_9_14_3_um_filter_63_12]